MRVFRRLGPLVKLWLPLAVSFELMMMEGPTVQGAMGRLPNSPLHLAAWGLTLSLSLLVESPVIMLLATAIALVQNADSYRALRQFMISLAIGCTVLTALVAFTPLFDFVAGRLMGQPPAIVSAARPAMQIMLFWTAAIAWRRFYQGILVRQGHTRLLSWGTAIRLAFAVGVSTGLAAWGRLPGVQVGAWALMAGVIAEALAMTVFALPIVRRNLLTTEKQEGSKEREAWQEEETQPASVLSQRDIWKFHAPLAATTLLTLLAQPMTSAALARLPRKTETLAAWPVVFLLLLVLRGWGLAIQEITVAQAQDPAMRPLLQRFAYVVGGITCLVTALIAFTPLLNLYLHHVIRLPLDLYRYARVGVGACLLLPLVTSLGSWARGLLVASGGTRFVYRGMGINLATHGVLLFVGVGLGLPGMWVAAGAFTCASLAEYMYLAFRAGQFA